MLAHYTMVPGCSRPLYLSSRCKLVRPRLTSVFRAGTFACYRSIWSAVDTEAKFKNAMQDAEKMVGYPTSFSSLKYLVDTEPANFIGLAKKLVGSGHPLLATARDLLSADLNNGKQLGGLWVLLLSKAAGAGTYLGGNDVLVNGIHPKQRIIAETAELISTAFLIHRSLLSLSKDTNLKELKNKTLSFGNKLSVLGGDYLLSKASLELAKLESTDCVELMSQAIGDMSEGATLEEMQLDISAWTVEDWENYVFLSQGSLMANSCQSALVLHHAGPQIREAGYAFGKYLAFAQQVCRDVDNFKDTKSCLRPYCLILWLCLFHDPRLKEVYMKYLSNISALKSSEELRAAVQSGISPIILEASLLCQAYVEKCRNEISHFKDADTVEAIQRILANISVK